MGHLLPLQARQAKESGRKDVLAAHFVGVDKEYCQIERLTNLDKLPDRLQSLRLPLKVVGDRPDRRALSRSSTTSPPATLPRPPAVSIQQGEKHAMTLGKPL
jgi:hypothetical protein